MARRIRVRFSYTLLWRQGGDRAHDEIRVKESSGVYQVQGKISERDKQ